MPVLGHNGLAGRRNALPALAALALLLVLAVLWPVGTVAADDDPLAGGRRQFLAAYAAVDSAAPGAAAADSDLLRAYPLYPYLVSARLQRRLDDPAAAPAIRAFLDTYADLPAARSLRSRWLMALAVGKRWKDYLSVYRVDLDDDSVAARCSSYTARIALDRTDGLADLVIAEWDSPESLPAACDPAFDWLRAGGLLKPDLIERRARNALAAGEAGLARFLAKSLPASTAAPILQWAGLIENPQGSIDALIAAPGTSVEPAALQDGWYRYARKDPEAAADRLPELLQARHLDTPEAASPYAITVGVQLALGRKPHALEFFAMGQPGDFNERSWEWQVRAALWAGDWVRVRDGIAAMPEDLRSQNRWRYWAARSAEQLGETATAKQGFAEVLPTDNWYAVLSAAHLGKRFTPSLEPMGLNDKEMGRLEAQPAFVRAREFVLCDMETPAMAEWRAAYASLPQPEQVQAIGLASRWGWYLQAIAAAAKLRIFNDYDVLYPRPYDPEVRRGAALTGLPPDLIYAIIRQESLYRADARSSAGALGLMQLLPATARRTAKAWDLPLRSTASLLQPSVNVPLGSAYLRTLYDRNGGQASLAMGSYNAGPNAVRRWLPDAPMAMDVWVENIPYNETRGYIQRVSWHMIVFGWLGDRRPRDVSGWLGTIHPPIENNDADP
jgi:soluble lytic murein transglycosylase